MPTDIHTVNYISSNEHIIVRYNFWLYHLFQWMHVCRKSRVEAICDTVQQNTTKGEMYALMFCKSIDRSRWIMYQNSLCAVSRMWFFVVTKSMKIARDLRTSASCWHWIWYMSLSLGCKTSWYLTQKHSVRFPGWIYWDKTFVQESPIIIFIIDLDIPSYCPNQSGTYSSPFIDKIIRSLFVIMTAKCGVSPK